MSAHLYNHMVSSDVLRTGARGGGVTVIGQVAKLIIQLLGVVILSRLLSPEDFGLVAMVGVFLALGNLVRDFGMPTAALSARTLSAQQASNIFWVNSALAAAAALTLAVLSPVLSWLYDEPRLAALVPALAVSILLNGVQSQLQVQLARSMRYTALTVTDIAAQLLGLVAALGCAMLGMGYWVLVVQVLVAAAALLVLRVAVARWVPSIPRRGAGTWELVRAGGHIGSAQLVAYAASNADTFMIGLQWGAAQTGLYNRAFELLTVPISRMLGPLSQVVIPTVSRAAEGSKSRMDQILLQLQPLFGGVVVWIFVTSASVADDLVPLLLGQQWHASIILFQILAVGGCFQAFSYISYWAFLVHGATRPLLSYNLVTKTLAVALVVAGSFISVEAVAWAYSLGLAISWPINLIWLAKTTGQHSARFFRNGVAILAAGLLAFLFARFVIGLVDDPWDLPLGVAASSLMFIGLIVAVPAGRRELRAGIVYLRGISDRR